jgi:alginate O-acetyltransferase complex protein AlgJ
MSSMATDSQAQAQRIKPPEDLRRSPIRAGVRRLVAVCFGAFLILVFVGTWLQWDPARSRENRNLAKLPALPRNYQEAKSYSSQVMVFYRDHFGFRNALIRAVALGKYHGLGPEVNNRIIVGKEGWLFYSKDEKFLADRGLDPFSESELDEWEELLEKREKWFADQGIPFLVVIPPDKQTIYPEYLPDEFRGFPTPSRLDQLIDRLRQRNSPVKIIDIRPALLEAKRHGQVYFKTDSHWNDDGAYAAYVALLEAIRKELPNRRLVPQPLSNFERRTVTKSGDLAQQLDLYFEYHEETSELIRKDFVGRPEAFEKLIQIPFTDGPDPSAPRLLTYNDSFTGPLVQFLSGSFSHATYFWNPITEIIDPAPVKGARPDMVIHEFVERKLHDPMPVDPPEIRDERIQLR